ncbi:MAG TPA: TRAP transporter small permease subunit [Noviherbaspirillum sp.]|uniref:TRAP transporter small permease n=1 Tax=Noviherbaspirillum sp. TaxID=1926288 RepID=UPI002B46E0FB|nr:TRAP transporter small permease subunit [Noviherbaspirillum sp.]HJV86095.1 TRAP transporter small permease subunit [Noviherbaspirillum sp.]
MRAFLDKLYNAAGYAAAFFMIGTLLMVVAGIADRMFALGWRGTDMYAGYSMAASGFLALAHTLKRGEHIRVTLILHAASPRMRHALEIWSHGIGAALAGAFAFYAMRLAYQSHEFNDISTGNDATPLWIPQIPMAIGAIVLFIALADDLVLELRGRRVALESEEAVHSE